MTPSGKCMQSGLIVLLLSFLAAQPSDSATIKYPDSSGSRQNLFLLGFGELTTQYLDVSGNANAFRAANPSLDEDVFSNYRFSLFANGDAAKGLLINGAAIVDSRIGDEYRTADPSVFRLRMSAESTEPLWDGWRFTGHGLYDPNRQWEIANLDTRLLTQPQEPSRLELLMRLESEEHGLIEGGSIRPSFAGARFTLHQRSVFGAYADLHTDRVGLEAVAGKLEGKSFREGSVMGIRANGTSGPYDLSRAPITRGSEEVKIEVRDRFDESTVIETRTLTRDIDYTVDYALGRILLHRPVASESVSSDPVYIVITFDYWRSESDDIVGGRARVMPVDGAQVSGTYLYRNIDDRAEGSGVEEPENLVAADGSFQIKDHSSGYVEIAGADNPDATDDHTALRLGAKTQVIDNLTLNADFQRIDDQFRSFTNSDLDPTRNQQRLQLGGAYKLTARQNTNVSVTSIRGLEANGDFNPYDGLRDEKILAAGYRNDLRDEFGFGFRAERRDVKDRSNTAHENNYQNRTMVDLGGSFKDVSLLGQFGYKVNYELIMFRNDLDIGRHDANTNQAAFTLTSRPTDRANIEMTHRLSLRNDRELDIYDDRQDASFATAQVRIHDNLNTLTTYEYKRYTVPGSSVQLWQDDPVRTERAGTFAVEYLPLEKIKALGKAGRHDSRQWLPDSATRVTSDFILGQVTYFHTHHLSFNAESEYRKAAKYFEERSHTRIWDMGLRVNWNRDPLNEFTAGMIRRWQSQGYPSSSGTTSSSYIMLLSGSASFTRHVFARGSVKGILLNRPLDDEKTFTRLEVGYDSQDWYRVSVGYERIASDTELHPDRNYTGQGAFVRFTGKM
jgi:hypothetical protein